VTGAVSPSRDEFLAHAREGSLVPVWRETLADLETPVSAFLKIHRGAYGFLLESVQGGERWGRFSFLGTEPACLIRVAGSVVELGSPGGPVERRSTSDPMQVVRDVLRGYRPLTMPGLPRFAGGAVGYVAYDMVRTFERLPATLPDDLGVPEALLLVTDTLLVFDNVAQTIKALTHARVGAEGAAAAWEQAVGRLDELLGRLRGPLPARPPRRRPASWAPRANLQPVEYRRRVERAQEYIRAGDVIQVVLAQRFEIPLAAAPFDVYRMLRTVNPSPYMFFLALGDLALAGASPEVMARVEDGVLTVRPIAGTRPRGESEDRDAALEQELRTDPKERAEHVMLVDLGRNDVGRVCIPGTVEVTERFVVERYSHVMHLVSNVRGRLRPGMDCFDAFRATFPAGTLTGAPKIRAMEIIEELEPVRRGVYGGAVGYFGFSGAMDTAIAIRSVLMRGDRAWVQAGAGIVADSDPAAEHQECVNKARAVLDAVRRAEDLP